MSMFPVVYLINDPSPLDSATPLVLTLFPIHGPMPSARRGTGRLDIMRYIRDPRGQT